jgi:O-antigen ligase
MLALLALGAAVALLPPEWVALAAGAAAGGILLLRRPWLVWPAIGAALPFAAGIRLAGPLSALDLLLAGAAALWLADGARRKSLRPAWSLPAALGALYALALLAAALAARDAREALTEIAKWVEFVAVLLILPDFLDAEARRRRGTQRTAFLTQGSRDAGDKLDAEARRRRETQRQATARQFSANLRASAPLRQGFSSANLCASVPLCRSLWLAAAILAGAVAQAALGLYQFVFAVGPEWFILPGGFMRAAGSFAQPNPFAGYLGLCLPVAVSLALWAGGRALRAGRTPADAAWALWFAGAAAIIAAGLLASWSRGGWLGAAAGVAAVIVLRSRRAALLSAVAALLLLAAALLGSVTPQAIPAAVREPVAARLAEIPAFFGAGDVLAQEVTDENFAVIERVAHWAAALRMWERAPWLGVGPGNYAAVYPEVRELRWEEALGHAHNVYLNVLAESGLIGFAAFLLLWGGSAVWLLRAASAARRAGAAFAGALAVGVLGVLAYLAVHSLFDNLFVQGMWVLLALWLALALPVVYFLRVLPPISSLYNYPVTPGWGPWVMGAGLILLGVAVLLPDRMTR